MGVAPAGRKQQALGAAPAAGDDRAMSDVPVLAPAQGAAAAESSAAAGKRRAPKMMIVAGAAVLVAGLAGALVLTHGFGHSGKASHAAAADTKPVGPPLYLALDPPFVVNFQADQLVRFLQVSVEVMSRD